MRVTKRTLQRRFVTATSATVVSCHEMRSGGERPVTPAGSLTFLPSRSKRPQAAAAPQTTAPRGGVGRTTGAGRPTVNPQGCTSLGRSGGWESSPIAPPHPKGQAIRVNSLIQLHHAKTVELQRLAVRRPRRLSARKRGI